MKECREIVNGREIETARQMHCVCPLSICTNPRTITKKSKIVVEYPKEWKLLLKSAKVDY